PGRARWHCRRRGSSRPSRRGPTPARAPSGHRRRRALPPARRRRGPPTGGPRPPAFAPRPTAAPARAGARCDRASRRASADECEEAQPWASTVTPASPGPAGYSGDGGAQERPLQRGEVAAVDRVHLPGDPLGGVAAQEDGERGGVADAAEATGRVGP